ncbi:MAG: FecR family protein [Opitutales bacterium]|nr:FecR family protein [Opitutales bacterium]
MKSASKRISGLLLLITSLCFTVSAQDGGEPKPGAIIVLSAKGLVQAIDPAGNVVPGTLKPGAVLAEGYSLKTGFGGEAAMLFSNGSVATVEPRSQVKVSTFLQKPFAGGNQKLADIKTEPSSSQITLDIDAGSLVVQTKKLNRSSNFTINTPNGTAGIRGTEFQLGVSSTGDTKLDVASSAVSFAPSGGNPVLVSQGKGIDVSGGGSISQRPIDPAISINISTKNAFASNIAGQIPLSTVNQAKEKAAAIAVLSESGAREQEPSKESKEESDDESSDDSGDSESSSEAAESFLNNQSNSFRSIPGAQTGSAYQKLVLKLANGELSAPNVNPGDDPGYYPTPSFTDFVISVDVDDNLVLTLTSLIADEAFNLAGMSADSIYPYLNDKQFKHNKYSNEVLAVGLSAFLKMQKAGVLPADDKINEALSAALDLSKVFLTNVLISNGSNFSFTEIDNNNLDTAQISNGKVLNAQNFLDKYKDNVYLFEVGMVLAEYGAFGNGRADSSNNDSNAPERADATSIALNILNFVGGRDLNIPDSISIGDEGSSGLINAALLGSTRNDLLNPPGLGQEGVTDSASKKENADRLYKIYLENIYGIVGADITVGAENENRIELDVSSVLTKAERDEGGKMVEDGSKKKILALAAARDLLIQSDLHIANDNHAEDHVLVLGAADHIEIYGDGNGAGASVNDEGGIQNIDGETEIFYEGSNLALGSYSALSLTNVDIDVGGNLAIGSLTDVDIKSSNFSVGRYSDRDNVYLYAENVLKVNGLTFDARPDDLNVRFESGTAREIYMEATTIDLQNVHFPANSEVMLRSRDGQPKFYGGKYDLTSRVPGAVNFYSNSNTYGGNDITRATFTNSPNANPIDGIPSGFNSIGDAFKTSTGDAGIKIRQFPK